MAAPLISERHKPHFHRQAPVLEHVRVATTANVAIATALNAGDTVDGVTLAAGDRVLVKSQSTGSQNGIYVAGTSPARDYDVSTDDPGFAYLVYVAEGTANGGKLFKNTNTSAPTIGTTALTFVEFTASHPDLATHDALGLATDAELAAHTGDTADAHDASAISVADAGGYFTGTDVEAALQELGAGGGGGGSGTLTTIEEVDGSPTDSAVTKLVFPNGTLSIVGHVATYTPAGGGGGSLTQAYVGYNTAGGTWESMTAQRVYAKKITLANDCLLTDIEAYVQGHSSDLVSALAVAIYDDASGTPDNLIQYVAGKDTTALLDDTTGAGGVDHPRWLGMPLGRWLVAGDYWICVAAYTNAGGWQIGKDGSGSDRYYTSGGQWFADWGWYAATTTTDKYSIRANTIR